MIWRRRASLEGSVPIVVSARRRASVVSFAVVPLTPFLKLRRDRSRGVAKPVAAIDIGAIAATDRVTPAAVVALILQGGLILRRQESIRIAEAIARAEIPTMTAWRRMSGNMVLHRLRRDRRNCSFWRHAQLCGQRCGGNADDHGHLPIKIRSRLRPTSALIVRPVGIEKQLLLGSIISKHALNIR